MPDEINKQIEKLRKDKAYFLSCFEKYGYGGDFREACRIQDEIDKLEELKSSNEEQKKH